MIDILSIPKELLEIIFQKDKSLMEQWEKDKVEWGKHLLKFGLYPDESNVPDRSYPLAPAFSSPHGMYIASDILKEYGLKIETLYTKNSMGYRSDEFVEEHDGKHILFAGCSVTFGDSLPIEHTWSRLVYDELSSKEKLSGYFNLGSPGASVIDIINSVVAYSEKFGTPDVVFMLLPDLIRDDSQFNRSQDPVVGDRVHSTQTNMYRMLEGFLEARGCSLYASSWDINSTIDSDVTYPISKEESFCRFSTDDFRSHVYDYVSNNHDHPYRSLIMKAADLAHPGIGENDFYKKLFLSNYKV